MDPELLARIWEDAETAAEEVRQRERAGTADIYGGRRADSRARGRRRSQRPGDEFVAQDAVESTSEDEDMDDIYLVPEEDEWTQKQDFHWSLSSASTGTYGLRYPKTAMSTYIGSSRGKSFSR